jgi:hypothetical protein
MYRLDYHPDKNRWHFIMLYSNDTPEENKSGWVTIARKETDGNRLHRFQQFVSNLPTPPPLHEIKKLWKEFRNPT